MILQPRQRLGARGLKLECNNKCVSSESSFGFDVESDGNGALIFFRAVRERYRKIHPAKRHLDRLINKLVSRRTKQSRVIYPAVAGNGNGGGSSGFIIRDA